MRCKDALQNNHPLGCFWLCLGALPLTEFVTETSADAVVFDAQHGLWDRKSLETAIGMVKDQMIPMVRLADGSRFAISSALDAGAEVVIVPLIETAEEAHNVVDWALYPPHGSRSGGGIRPLRDFPAYKEQADKTTVTALMIETARGVDNLAEILKTPHLDMIFIGTGDLSLSLGLAPTEPAYEATIQDIKRQCEAANVSCGIFTATLQQAKARRDQGFSLVVIGDDITANRSYFSTQLTEFSAT
tara:strand:- start:486 stop:1220 length:735 start_codon:yes stop_codon:yes gene_type:complete